MPKGMAALAALVLAVSIAMPAAAQIPSADDGPALSRREQGKQAREAARGARMLSETAAIYTDIVELTLADRADAIRLRAMAARASLERVRPMLPDEAYGALESRVGDLEAAREKGDRTGAALAALEGFRIITTSADPRLRRMPVEISLQSYSAFKLTILASAAQLDWPTMRQAAKDSEKNWIALRRFVRDTNLRVLLSRMQSGLREAVAREDATAVKFAASLQLASSAVLQDFFARFARTMARGRGGEMSQMQTGR